MAEQTQGPWETLGALIWSPSAHKVVAGASALQPSSGTVRYEAPGSGEPEISANASLLASSPGLLAFVEHIFDALTDGRPEMDRTTMDHYANEARSAIAKART